VTPWDASRLLVELEAELRRKHDFVLRLRFPGVDLAHQCDVCQKLRDALQSIDPLRAEVFALVEASRGNVTRRERP